MAKKRQQIKLEEDYIAFLKKRLESKNYKNNKTQEKYDKAKFRLKMLRGG